MNIEFPLGTAADKLWERALLARATGNLQRAHELEIWVTIVCPEGYSLENFARHQLDCAKLAVWQGASLEWVEQSYLGPLEHIMRFSTDLIIELWVMRAFLAITHPNSEHQNIEMAARAVAKVEPLLSDCHNPFTIERAGRRLTIVKQVLST